MPSSQSIAAAALKRARPMPRFSTLLDMWPTEDGQQSTALIAHELELSYYTVHSWRRRNAIPQIWWDKLEASARAHGVKGVTYSSFKEIDDTLRGFISPRASHRSAARER
jgi:hypothetical protein